jgi:hypothetical protein
MEDLENGKESRKSSVSGNKWNKIEATSNKQAAVRWRTWKNYGDWKIQSATRKAGDFTK